MIDLSVIIPVYNEEKTILKILERIHETKSKNYTYEIVVINDGSSDRTLNILEKNSNLYNILINNKTNMGKGYSVKMGLEQATGKYIIFQDADLEYDPEEFLNILEIYKKFDADIVYGSRINYRSYSKSHNFLNLVANKSLTLFFNILFNCTFTDIYSCYLSFKKELIDTNQLKCFGFGQQAELLCQIIKKSKNNYEIPINYNGRSIEDGKKIKWYHFFSVIFEITKGRILK